MCLTNGYHISNQNGENMRRPELNVAENEVEMVKQLHKYLVQKLTYLLEQHGIVSIGVSGGSMPKVFTKAFVAATADLKNQNLKRIRIFMVDERNVEKDDEDSNLGAYLNIFPEELHELFVPFQYHKDPRHTAQTYELNLRKYLLPEQLNAVARFDLIFLGVGPDGHTASLFPGKERLEKVTDFNWVAATLDSPKPPSDRITLTMSVLQHSKNLAFIITGAQKAEVARAVYHRDLKYPAAMARPYHEKFTMFLDEDAAKEIHNENSSDSESSPPPFDD